MAFGLVTSPALSHSVSQALSHCGGDFSFDAEQYPIRESLLEACGFPSTTDLTTLHELGFGAKDARSQLGERTKT